MKTVIASLFIFISLVPISYSQEDIALLDPFLSDNYTRGGNLIYDCRSKHWVCTGNGEFDYCQKERTFGVNEKISDLGCVPVKVFASEKACIDSQKNLVSGNFGMRFCQHPDLQEANKLIK